MDCDADWALNRLLSPSVTKLPVRVWMVSGSDWRFNDILMKRVTIATCSRTALWVPH